jgi:L-asparaginase
MVAIARRVGTLLTGGATGVVVSHGTDTLELTAFTLQLLLGTTPQRRPVVVTGSMRPHSHPAPDGPGNLRDALAVAASSVAVGQEVLVCLGAEIHAASRVTKLSTDTVDAFTSTPLGSIGRVADGTVRITGSCGAPRRAASGLSVDVPLVACYPSIPAADVERAAEGHRGLVLEVFGDLNVPRHLWGPVHRITSSGTLVVLASRPFTPTLTNEGLQALGAVGAGGLTAQKARLATMAALSTCADRDDAIAFLHSYALLRAVPDGSPST